MSQKFGFKIKVNIDDSPKIGRNYKISSDKLKNNFKWKPVYSVEDSVEDLVKNITKNNNTDFTHPKYYNIEWMKLLIETKQILSASKKIF